MATFRIWYHRSGCIDIEAETQEDAIEEFDYMSTRELDRNCFGGDGYERDEVEEV